MLRHNERTSAFETFDDEQNCMCEQLRWAATTAMMMIHGNIVDNDIISLFIACELAQWEAQRGLMRVCVEFALHSAMIEVIVIRNLYHQSANKSLTMKLTSWRLSLLQFRREFYLLLIHWRAATLSLYIHDFECTSVALSSLLVYIFFLAFQSHWQANSQSVWQVQVQRRECSTQAPNFHRYSTHRRASANHQTKNFFFCRFVLLLLLCFSSSPNSQLTKTHNISLR